MKKKQEYKNRKFIVRMEKDAMLKQLVQFLRKLSFSSLEVSRSFWKDFGILATRHEARSVNICEP